MKRYVVYSLLVFVFCERVEEVKVNNAPIAVLAENTLITFPLTPLILDGTGSYDPDGDPVYYHWELKSSPNGSQPLLEGRESPLAVFYADVPGIYEVSFSVSDGDLSSASIDAVIEVSSVSFQPQAFIKDEIIESEVNESVFISGIMSLNPIDEPLYYEWQVVSAPPSSNISFPYGVSMPYLSFVPDVPHGEYLVVLRVYNRYSDGTTDWVKVRVKNREPEVELKANVIDSYEAGSSIYVDDRDRVRFNDYSSFHDSDNDRLSYHWTYNYTHIRGTYPTGHGFVCPAQGSGVFEECNDTPDRVTFTVGNSADGEGVYEVSVEVSDGYGKVNRKVLLMRKGAPPPSIDISDYHLPHRWKDGLYTSQGDVSVVMKNLYSDSVSVKWSVEVRGTPNSLAPTPIFTPSEGFVTIPASSQSAVNVHFKAETQRASIIGKYTLLFKACLSGTNTCSKRTFFVYVENQPPSIVEVPNYMIFKFRKCTYYQFGDIGMYLGEPSASFLLPLYAEDSDGDPMEVEVSFGDSTLLNFVSLEGDFLPVNFDVNSGVHYEKNVVLCALPWSCESASWGWSGAQSHNKYTELIVSVKDPWGYGPLKKVKLYPECL